MDDALAHNEVAVDGCEAKGDASTLASDSASVLWWKDVDEALI